MRIRFIIAIITVLALLLWYYSTIMTSNTLTPVSANKENIVEAYLYNFKSNTLDESGKLSSTVSSPHAVKFQGKEQLEIQLPIIKLQQEQTEWLISAQTADINTETNLVKLNDNVRLENQTKKALLTTQHITINTDTKTAISTDDVTIKINGSNSFSSGITINMQEETLLLPANVRSSYLPKPKQPK